MSDRRTWTVRRPRTPKGIAASTPPFTVATDREVLMRGAGELSMTKIGPGSYHVRFDTSVALCAHCGDPVPPDTMHWARARFNVSTGQQEQAVWCDRHGVNGPPWERDDPPIIRWKFEPFKRVQR